MRIIYSVVIVVVFAVLLVGIPKWLGPVLPALTIKLMPLELRIVASGEVRYQSLARIGSEITGTVKDRYVREGDQVNKGDLLIELNPEGLPSRLAQQQTLLQQLYIITRPQAQAELVEANDNLRQASREARRREALAQKDLLSTEQVEQAQRTELNAKTSLTYAQLTADSLAANSTEEQLLQQRVNSAKADLAKTLIYAPFAGRIQTRNVEPGDLVQPGKVLLEIARSDGQNREDIANDGLEVVIAVDEKNFSPLQLGQPVQLIADAWPEVSVAGIVSFIAPAVDSERGTIDVHIKVLAAPLNKQHIFLQGMTISANIIAAEREKTLVLPNDYLYSLSGKTHVFCWENGVVSEAEVVLGLRNTTHSEIVSGLAEGDVVVQTDNLMNGQRARVDFEQVKYVIR